MAADIRGFAAVTIAENGEDVSFSGNKMIWSVWNLWFHRLFLAGFSIYYLVLKARQVKRVASKNT